MCYMITSEEDGVSVTYQANTKNDAMQEAEKLALAGHTCVKVWALAHTFEKEVRVNVTDHFKATV